MSPDPKAIPWQKILRLMVEDIDRIDQFLDGMDQQSFLRDERTIFAVCYAFVRIGQGVVMLPDEFRAAHPSVPWREARHFRNFMVHVYMAVDPLRLYETARNDLPQLKRSLGDLLNTDLEP